jgi:hypothetical protein
MAERKTIGSISIITDSETGYDNIGDVDGGFSETELKKHIETHGHEGLCEKLTSMSWQVWSVLREINAESFRAVLNEAKLNDKK